MSALPSSRRLKFWRALRRKCPACGAGHIFRRWLFIVPSCPACGLRLDRKESGYSLGGFWLNLLFAEGVTATIFVTTLVSCWPDVPWTLLQYGLPSLALITPVVFYPFSKTLFLALDLSVRPTERRDRE